VFHVGGGKQQGKRQHKLALEPGTLLSYVFNSFCHEISIY
jgi:hypothetical protein